MHTTVKLILVIAFITYIKLATAMAAPVIVNGKPLNQKTIAALTKQYGPIAEGRYWYDKISGLWGYEGGPTVGQIHPGLNLGGPLKTNASGGGTQVFINGREIHVTEYYQLLAAYGRVIPGRYWMNSQLIGGFEGGPPFFNLAAQGNRNGNRNWSNHSDYGSVGGDGNGFSYFIDGDSSVTIGP